MMATGSLDFPRKGDVLIVDLFQAQLAIYGRILVLAVFISTPFTVHEGVLFGATGALPSSAEAFSLQVIVRIFYVSAVAFAGLLATHWIALRSLIS